MSSRSGISRSAFCKSLCVILRLPSRVLQPHIRRAKTRTPQGTAPMNTILVIDSAVSGDASVSTPARPRGGRRPDRARDLARHLPRPRHRAGAAPDRSHRRRRPRRAGDRGRARVARALRRADRRAPRRRHHRDRRADVQLQHPDDAARRGSTTCCAPARPSATPRPARRACSTGKRVIVVESRGGLYSEGPAQAIDFQEPYLRHLLGFIGLTDVTFVHAEKIGYGAGRARRRHHRRHGRTAPARRIRPRPGGLTPPRLARIPRQPCHCDVSSSAACSCRWPCRPSPSPPSPPRS